MQFLNFLLSVYRALPGAVSQGILWGLITLGVYISFRLLNMADMTVDGSFAAGGAVTAVLVTQGMDSYLTLIFVFIVGLLCGLMTGFMTTKMRINILLAGILSQIALYSINIRIMGRPNTPLIGVSTMMTKFNEGIVFIASKIKGITLYVIDPVVQKSLDFIAQVKQGAEYAASPVIKGVTDIAERLGEANKYILTPEGKQLIKGVNKALPPTIVSLIIGAIVVAIIIYIVYLFFGTEYGSAIRATGSNENMVRALGVNTDMTKIFGLMISNGLVALSGAFVAQSQGYGDVLMGQGAIVSALAAIIIGEVIFGNRFGLWWSLIAVVFGSIIYRIVIATALAIPGFKSTDLKLITAVIVAISLSVPVIKNNIDKRRRAYFGPANEVDTRHADDKFKH